MKPLSSDINVGLLECNTPERYEQLGRMVVQYLSQDSAKRTMKIGKAVWMYREVVIHAS